MAVVLLTVACGGGAPVAAPVMTDQGYPATGLVLLSLADGSRRASASVGTDPVAVTVAADGTMAYLADSTPGDVYAVRLPALTVAWKQHVGGAPFGLLIDGARLYVSLFSAASVVELDPKTGILIGMHSVPEGPAAMAIAPGGRVLVASTSGAVTYLDGPSMSAGQGYGIAVIGTEIWTADYKRAELVRARDDHRVPLPLGVFPFWLAPGSAGTLLVSAEGAEEDSDPGAVYSFDPTTEALTSLGLPRDPDQVVQSGSKVLVAAHGDRNVLAIEGGTTKEWAQGAEAVAIAPDAPLNLLVVAVNAHE
jgi:DNA-binding beta-propeller fold protein YncE